MYRERLLTTEVASAPAQRLQAALLDYHDFRYQPVPSALDYSLTQLSQWQTERLKRTHADLYQHPHYASGLTFLLSDLYQPTRLTRRDDDIDRVFPKLVKWVPDDLLNTLAGLVELNLVTRQLDLAMAARLSTHRQLDEHHWCAAYRDCQQISAREQQLLLVSEVGLQLDRYVSKRSIGWLLAMTEGAADLAGLQDLHDFLHRGYRAFRGMDNVPALINLLVVRERRIMQQVLAGHLQPLQLREQLLTIQETGGTPGQA
ncbi:MAG: hypothetical protein LAT63_11750 [Marinobacter sp.]|nr:hypothetical protein [Marinobacter sp.]